MSTAEKKEKKHELRRKREKLEDEAIAKAARLEKLELERAELQEDKAEAKAENEEEQARIKSELATNHRLIAEVREDEDRLDSAIDKVTARIRRLAREIQSAATGPTIIDLKMPMARAGSAMQPIIGSVGHYTAGPLARTDEEAVRMWWQVRSQHIGQGWSNIGYHYGLGPEGKIYILRPVQYQGAHTLGENENRVGLSVHGTTGHTWTRAQRRALRQLLRAKGLENKPVHGHNDFNPTACPGAFKSGYTSKGRNP